MEHSDKLIFGVSYDKVMERCILVPHTSMSVINKTQQWFL